MKIRVDDITWRWINLLHRGDRRDHMAGQLRKAHITAERFPALTKDDYQGSEADVAMMQATPNTIGNWLSHTAVIRTAIDNGIVGLLEDDALLCSDFLLRLQYIEDKFDKPWDIFFLGATFHADECVWHPELGHDFELTDIKHIVRTYGAFSNQGYLINPDSAEKILDMMRGRMYKSRGSDHALIQIQPMLNCYCFVPGLVFQIDGQSDIGDGVTKFSSFLTSLGQYVWTDMLDEFDWDKWRKEHEANNEH